MTYLIQKEKHQIKEQDNGKSNESYKIQELFFMESREEFLNQLKSKSSLPFLTQLTAQKEEIFFNNAPKIAVEAYRKSIKISDLIYGKIEDTYFFA